MAAGSAERQSIVALDCNSSGEVGCAGNGLVVNVTARDRTGGCNSARAESKVAASSGDVAAVGC